MKTFIVISSCLSFIYSIECRALSSSVFQNFNSSETPYIRHTFGDRYLDEIPRFCRRKATCVLLSNTTCMGAKLPYHLTTLDLTDLSSQTKVQEKLQLYEQYLRYIPTCWQVIQPFLCALYMPKCELGEVDLPSYEMCKVTLEPCKGIFNSSLFPEFFNCKDNRLFPSMCRNEIHDMKFNLTGHCMEPLIETDNPEWYFKDIEGCGLHCMDARYTESEHNQIHQLITYGAIICIILNFFTALTFFIDWKSANRYPAKGIFFINICFVISYSGYLAQFFGSDTREDIVCKKDGTLRKWEPSATENLSCVTVFFVVYYFLIAGLVWFMIFCYSWYMNSLQALGKIQERIDKKEAYFHLVAWSLPLMLTITTMAIGEIDGDYITGICFVGFANWAARIGLFLFPFAAIMLVSIYIIIRGLILLVKVQIDSKEIISENSTRKIRSNIIRMTVFTIFMVIFCVVTIVYHVYVASNRDLWQTSLENYVWCKLTSFGTGYSHCKQSERPSVAMLQLHLIAVFGKGAAMASWVWYSATLHAWGRFIRKKFHCEVEEPLKIKKHKIIARVFARRKKFNEGGVISICSANHTDPVGLQFELNSAASNGLNLTSWAKNLPRLVNRRPAVPNDVGADNSYQSIDSVSYRHVSIESRRNSGDSQVSVQIAELKATKRVKTRRMRRSDRHQFRRNSRNIGNSTRTPSRRSTKRGSSTSLDSNLQLLNALANASDGSKFAPNLNRRTATAGLDGAQLGQLLSNGKLILPPTAQSCSEDENVSVTISETAVSMRVGNQNLDLNDHFTISQLKHGLCWQPESSESEHEEYESQICPQIQKKSRIKGSSESRLCPQTLADTNSDSSSDYEINPLDKDNVAKSKQTKTRNNKRFHRESKSKEKYQCDGTTDEKRELCDESGRKYWDNDEEVLFIKGKSQVFIQKSKEF
ncbi:protein smoothened isoform X1 [Euwallacea fornicatus]|uniref:protein smoothened isoform X1 n=1 Tax=Euwallacea fornicatus TaxID=995702 RepID=UPI00338FC8DD